MNDTRAPSSSARNTATETETKTETMAETKTDLVIKQIAWAAVCLFSMMRNAFDSYMGMQATVSINPSLGDFTYPAQVVECLYPGIRIEFANHQAKISIDPMYRREKCTFPGSDDVIEYVKHLKNAHVQSEYRRIGDDIFRLEMVGDPLLQTAQYRDVIRRINGVQDKTPAMVNFVESYDKVV